MILPFVSAILNFRMAPVTWSLFALQFLVYFYSVIPIAESKHNLDAVINDPVFTEFQGRLFASHVLNGNHLYPEDIRKLSHQTLMLNQRDKAQVLGSLAFRDIAFVKAADNLEIFDDPVIFKWWKSKFKALQEYRESHPSYLFGVSESGTDFMKWISYQFSHSGGMHLFSNMIFLLVFGWALEVTIGGLGLLITFVGSGLMAAGVFLLLEEPSAVPLIGASGAVSGLMALFACLYWKRGVRFIYWLFIPKKGYFGFVYLPGWMILVPWAMADLTGYFSTPETLGGIAYSAHLGGELCGVVIGVSVFLLRKYFTKQPWPYRSAFIDEKPIFTTVN